MSLITNISGENFLHELGSRIKTFQDKGYEVEVHYGEKYHALVLAYEVEVMGIIEAANKYFGYEVKDVQELFHEMDEEFTYNRRWIEVMQFLKCMERQEKR